MPCALQNLQVGSQFKTSIALIQNQSPSSGRLCLSGVARAALSSAPLFRAKHDRQGAPMMARDDRFYAFIVAHTSNPSSRIRRISLHKRWVKACVCAVAVLLGVAAYGIYGLTQQALHLRVAYENQRLRAENEKQRQQLNSLNQRVEAVENVSRRIAEMSGVEHPSEQQASSQRGAGGPELPFDIATTIE